MGSCELRKAFERLLSRSVRLACGKGRPRFELVDERRGSSFWKPALIVAAAAREELEAWREGE